MGNRITALNFHGLGEPHAAVPEEEKPYWLPVDRFNTIVERVVRSHDPAAFVFTFDDGNKSDLMGAEILARHGLRGRFFLLAGRFDLEHYCSHDDARSLVAQGMIVGLHGRSHRDWQTLDNDGLADETVAARAELAEVIGDPVTEVAIPFGSYNRRVMKWLKQQGFTRIHTSDRGTCDPSARIWNRNTLRSDMPDAEIAALLEGRAPVSQRIRRSLVSSLKRNLI